MYFIYYFSCNTVRVLPQTCLLFRLQTVVLFQGTKFKTFFKPKTVVNKRNVSKEIKQKDTQKHLIVT